MVFPEKPKLMNCEAGLKKAQRVVGLYDGLVARALEVVSKQPFYIGVDHDESAALRFDGEMAVLTWSYYESDYYGGGYMQDRTAQFPAWTLFLTDDELNATRAEAKRATDEQNDRLIKAQRAVALTRDEAMDRANYKRLLKKCGAPKSEGG